MSIVPVGAVTPQGGGMVLQCALYRPRDPENTLLHAVIREHLETFLREAADRTDGSGAAAVRGGGVSDVPAVRRPILREIGTWLAGARRLIARLGPQKLLGDGHWSADLHARRCRVRNGRRHHWASACASQNSMPISRYMSDAVARCSSAVVLRPARLRSRPRPR